MKLLQKVDGVQGAWFLLETANKRKNKLFRVRDEKNQNIIIPLFFRTVGRKSVNGIVDTTRMVIVATEENSNNLSANTLKKVVIELIPCTTNDPRFILGLPAILPDLCVETSTIGIFAARTLEA